MKINNFNKILMLLAFSQVHYLALANYNYNSFFNVTSTLTALTITNTQNKDYPYAGIKINTPNVSLSGVGSDCTLLSNGYCMFSIDQGMCNIINFDGTGAPNINFNLCLNGKGPLSCQVYNIKKPFILDDVDFTAYDVVQDITPSPYFPLSTVLAGVHENAILDGFATSPTNGLYTAVTGFDGSGPGHIILAKDLSAGYTSLSFDYRVAWDLIPYGATQNRTFKVRVEPYGGGAALLETLVFTITAGTRNSDTGNLSEVIDLSPFVNQRIRIVFDWYVPEDFTGPAFFQFDNVRFD